jgi:hypothetical protein
MLGRTICLSADQDLHSQYRVKVPIILRGISGAFFNLYISYSSAKLYTAYI